MLHAPCSSSCMDTSSGPLFGGESSFSLFGGVSSPSSCGMEVSTSFDWSDYPIVYQEDSINNHVMVDLSAQYQYYEQQQQQAQAQQTDVAVPVASSSSSVMMDTSSSSSSSSEKTPLPTSSTSTSTPSTKTNHHHHKKSVSWGNALEIRIHSIVLGDHPCCHGPLPLQLGWEYNDTQLVSLESHEQYKKQMTMPPPPPTFQSSSSRSASSSNKSPPRLTFMERKNVLKHISGMSERDITNAIMIQQQHQ